MTELLSKFLKPEIRRPLKRCIKNGTIFTALGELVLLGRSPKAINILILSLQFKMKNKLEKQYRSKLLEFDDNYNSNLIHENSNKVWVCWFQGMETAPDIVKICYESIKRELFDKEIILITKKNMFDYVEFPESLIKKWDNGIISDAHMSDLLRLELLIKYGGIWIDSTVYCSGSNIPDYIFDSDLFLYQELEPGSEVQPILISNWLISAKTNNKILMAVKFLLFEYWEKNNFVVDYFIFHIFMSIVLEFYSDDWKKIMPASNTDPHLLLFRLFEDYDENIWESIKNKTCFHKLTYKLDENDVHKNNTYYKKIVESENLNNYNYI